MNDDKRRGHRRKGVQIKDLAGAGLEDERATSGQALQSGLRLLKFEVEGRGCFSDGWRIATVHGHVIDMPPHLPIELGHLISNPCALPSLSDDREGKATRPTKSRSLDAYGLNTSFAATEAPNAGWEPPTM